MKTLHPWLLVVCLSVWMTFSVQAAEEGTTVPPGDTWTKALKDRAKRGTLHNAMQRVRGDSGKWNDHPQLQHAPSIKDKPPKMQLDDWADQNVTKGKFLPTANDENWLVFKTRQLDDNDRVWVQRIERKGNRFTIVLDEAIWQGRYFKSFTYYNVYAVNLGKLPPGKYQAKWIVRPLAFRKFAGDDGRPRNKQRKENWSIDESPVDKKPTEMSVTFSVAAAP